MQRCKQRDFIQFKAQICVTSSIGFNYVHYLLPSNFVKLLLPLSVKVHRGLCWSPDTGHVKELLMCGNVSRLDGKKSQSQPPNGYSSHAQEFQRVPERRLRSFNACTWTLCSNLEHIRPLRKGHLIPATIFGHNVCLSNILWKDDRMLHHCHHVTQTL